MTLLRTIRHEPIAELSSWQYVGVLMDQRGEPVGAADLDTLTLTLYDKETGTILNGVDGTNILNTDRGTLDADGNLTITFRPNDNALHNSALLHEVHEALISWTWTTGGVSHAGRKVVQFTIENLLKVS